MAVAVAQFHAGNSPLNAIANALDVAASVYGIKAASQKAELVRQQLAKNDAEMELAHQNADPTSPVSQAKQAYQAAYIDAARKKGDIDQARASSILNLIQGQPERDLAGPTRPGETLKSAAVPPLSGDQLDNALKEGGQLADFVKGEQAAASKYAGFNFRDSQIQDRQDFQAHQKNLARLKGDPQLSKRLAQYQNLQNALSNFQNAEITNPQAIDELQQGIRQNLGIGGGGVGEREHTYINSLGLNADRIKQFITGDPVAISKDSALATHLKQLVGLESENIANQTKKRISALTAGNASVYERHPEYASDLQDAINAAGDQFSAAPTPASASTSGDQAATPTASPQTSIWSSIIPSAGASGVHPSTQEAAKAILEQRRSKRAGNAGSQ